jgi:hypothetical protein
MRSKHLDSLLFAIGVHGPTVAFEHLPYIRRLRTTDKDAFREVKMTLIEAGMEHGDVMEMVLGQHEVGCACWRCVLMLHTQALRHHVRLQEK